MALALVMLAGGAGCGKPVLRIADASLGDYYTDKEFRKLREEQRLEYCQELADQDSIYREEIAEARYAADRFSSRATLARAVADSLARLADSLEAAVARAKSGGRPRVAETAPGGPAPAAAAGAGADRITVREGDSLWRIAARESIYGNGREWPRLYEANRSRIRDAHRIFPGQELIVPK
jgi:nucleoid-associated protein YgaU